MIEFKIFNDIRTSHLMPWSLDGKVKKQIRVCIRNLNEPELQTLSDLTTYIASLLQPFAHLREWIIKESSKYDIPLKGMLYTTEVPENFDVFSLFYSLLITLESRRLYNLFLLKTKDITDKKYLESIVQRLLKKNLVLLLKIRQEMKLRELDQKSISTDLNAFVLYYLQYELVVFYFSVQDTYKGVPEKLISLEKFYLTELGENKSTIHVIKKLKRSQLHLITHEEKINLGFTGNPQELRNVLKDLYDTVKLLKEFNDLENLVDVLTTQKVAVGAYKIHLGCQTKQFCYIIDCLQLYFDYLTPRNLQESNIFLTITGKPLRENHLSSSKSKNKTYPQKKDKIDEIFRKHDLRKTKKG